MLVRYANLSIVCDPMLGRWCRGIRREIQPGLSPAELADVDLILVSHDHPDHLHRPTLAKLPRAATVVLPPRTAQHVSDLGFARVVELRAGQSVQHRRVDIAATAVRHGSTNSPAVGYVIRGEGPSVFFCGASGYFPGFADVGRRYRPDIALLPIGGYLAPSWAGGHSFRERHMSPLDALYAFEDLQSRVLIPHHFGSFSLSYEVMAEPERWMRRLIADNDLEVHIQLLLPGESRVFCPPGQAARAKQTREADPTFSLPPVDDAIPITVTES
jgi:L-ascorbate metabolism protein UlaG (beta-lactamase superfamily)